MASDLIDGDAHETHDTRHAPRRVALETRAECPTCGAPEHDSVWRDRFSAEPTHAWLSRHAAERHLLAELGPQSFELVRCRVCTMLFHTRVLAPALTARLGAADAGVGELGETDARAAQLDQTRRTLALLRLLHASAGAPARFRLLDVGGGDGRAVELGAALGFETWHVTLSVHVPRARRAERVRGSIEEIVAAGGEVFDAVLVRNALEHLVQPRRELGRVVDVLRPGGIVSVEVPDASAIEGPPRDLAQFRLVHPLRHPNAFTAATVERLAVNVGLSPARAMAALPSPRASHASGRGGAHGLAEPIARRCFVRSRRPAV